MLSRETFLDQQIWRTVYYIQTANEILTIFLWAVLVYFSYCHIVSSFSCFYNIPLASTSMYWQVLLEWSEKSGNDIAGYNKCIINCSKDKLLMAALCTSHSNHRVRDKTSDFLSVLDNFRACHARCGEIIEEFVCKVSVFLFKCRAL